MGELYDLVSAAGAEVVGFWSSAGYEFNDSAALDGDDFVGLALDQDNQADQTAERIKGWVATIKPALGL